MDLLFLISTVGLVYPYLYGILVKILPKRCKLYNLKTTNLTLSVIISAFNEENSIINRIKNILGSNYPQDKLEIIIGSDGSTDRTVEVIKDFLKKNKITNIKVLDFKVNRGRAAVHNDCVKHATGEILVFTDAETVFDKNFLREIIKPYIQRKDVGVTVGNLHYLISNKKGQTEISEGLFFKLEKAIRKAESDACLLFTGTGACMSVKKDLWVDLAPTDDVDFATPLYAILQGYKVIYVPEAKAYDRPPSNFKREFKLRIRQTAKNLLGTLRIWGWKNIFKHPLYTWAIFSHKILRWLSPFFLITLFVSNIFLLNESWFYKITFALQVLFYLCGLIGFKIKKFPCSVISSFLVANAGIFLGVLKAIAGKAPSFYGREKESER